MKLRSVEIANCRSIERAKFTSFEQTNVLIGRNNSGKSAFFRALWHVAQKLQNQSVEWSRTIRNASDRNRLEVRLRFSLDDSERLTFIREAFNSSNVGEERLSALLNGPFARFAEFYVSTVDKHPDLMHLFETNLFGEDAAWACVHKLQGNETEGNPTCVLSQLEALDLTNSLAASAISLDTAPKLQTRGTFFEWSRRPEAWGFLQRRFAMYFLNAFFFQASRRSDDRLPAQAAERLASDGSNLPQVLLRIRTNHDQQFEAIVQLIKGALPDIGQLQTPMTSNQTSIGFRQPDLRDPIPLMDMGTGVQQLLMVAVLLATTGEETSLFIEEPESNLHPGAQRFLLSRLQAERRQVFMTTHSPVLVNVRPPSSIHRIKLFDAKTTVEPVKDSEDLAEALGLIGATNSDVLLSDAVLFVEGPSDREILLAWSRVLGIPLDERGITILTLGGADGGHRPLQVRQEVLEGISRKSHIPHTFVIDRDERTDQELESLKRAVGSSLNILERRELENYLMEPSAISVAINDALARRGITPKLDSSSVRIATRMREIAVSLRGTVFLKRIRAASSRVSGGLFPRESLSELRGHEDDPYLSEKIGAMLTARFNNWLRQSSLEKAVAQERGYIDAAWASGDDAIFAIVPGADVLQILFADYDLPFDKSVDGARIATAMAPQDIADQIKTIIGWNPAR